MAYVPNSGSVVAFQGTVPWSVVGITTGSVISIQQGSIAAVIIGGSVAGIANQSVSGTINTSQTGTVFSSVQNIIPSSLQSQVVGDSNNGAADVSNRPVGVGGRYLATPGSYSDGNRATILMDVNGRQVINPSNSSIISVSVGSVQNVWLSPSIVGTYLEDAASATGDRGIFTLNARNDTMASVSSADGDYTQLTVGPVGEAIVANAPLTKWVSGTTSVLNQFGTSMVTVAAQGSSIFTYITSGQVANMSGSSVLVTFSGATSSVIGYTIAPPGGGSNMVIPNAWKSNANGAITASVSGASSVYISLQGFISKT